MTIKSPSDAANALKNMHLPNGARLIDFEYKGEFVREGVVLAKSNGVQPYVTWMFYRKDFSTTSHGHYFKTLAEAAKDYEKRKKDYEQE